MKRFYIFILLMALIPFYANGTILMSENWDSGTPDANWPCKSSSDCTYLTFDGWQSLRYYCSSYPTWGNSTTLDTDIKYSGTRSLKMVRTAGQSDSCPIQKTFTSTSKIYVSMYLYFPSSTWASWDISAEAGNAGEHFMFLNNAMSGSTQRTLVDIMDFEAYSPGTGGLPYCWSNVSNQAYFWPKRGADGNPSYNDSSRDDCWRIDQHTNAWHKFTWMFDATNNKYALWRDGAQVVGTGGEGVTQVLNDGTPWSSIILDLYNSYVTVSNPATFYVDDIIVATTLAEVEGGGDTTAPTIVNVSSDKANGSYKAGEVIDIDVTFSENVTSTGNVTVELETGATDRTCTFTVTNASSGSCNYTVQAGDASGDLTVKSISGTIADQSSNAMSNFTPATNLAANKALVIDTTAPIVEAFSVPATSNTRLVKSDDFQCLGQSAFIMTESAEAPSLSNPAWTTTAPSSYTFDSDGEKTLYGYCRDLAGNVSDGSSDTVTVTTTGGAYKAPFIIQ